MEIQTNEESESSESVDGNEATNTSNVGIIKATELLEDSPKQGEEEKELLAGKYKTVEDLEKGYKEVMQKLTTKNPEAPDEYSVDLSDAEDLAEIAEKFDIEFDAANPVFDKFTKFAKDSNLSNEQYNQALGLYVQAIASTKPDIDEAFKDLGVDGKEITDGIASFVDSKLTPEEISIVESELNTAGLAKVFHKVIQMTGEKSIPVNPGGDKAGSVEDGQSLIDEAMAYKKKHEATISMNPGQQKTYHNLLTKGSALKEKAEKQALAST